MAHTKGLDQSVSLSMRLADVEQRLSNMGKQLNRIEGMIRGSKTVNTYTARIEPKPKFGDYKRSGQPRG
jgi:hypothetical protein